MNTSLMTLDSRQPSLTKRNANRGMRCVQTCSHRTPALYRVKHTRVHRHTHGHTQTHTHTHTQTHTHTHTHTQTELCQIYICLGLPNWCGQYFVPSIRRRAKGRREQRGGGLVERGAKSHLSSAASSSPTTPFANSLYMLVSSTSSRYGIG